MHITGWVNLFRKSAWSHKSATMGCWLLASYSFWGGWTLLWRVEHWARNQKKRGTWALGFPVYLFACPPVRDNNPCPFLYRSGYNEHTGHACVSLLKWAEYQINPTECRFPVLVSAGLPFIVGMATHPSICLGPDDARCPSIILNSTPFILICRRCIIMSLGLWQTYLWLPT